MSFSKWTPIINETTEKNNTYITPNVRAFLSGIGDFSRESIFNSRKDNLIMLCVLLLC